VDYLGQAGLLVFDPGVTNLIIEIPVLGDVLDEGFETFFLNLSEPTNGVIVVGSARFRIFDNDPRPRLDVGDAMVTETISGQTNQAEFGVSLSAASGLTVRVAFATENDTAEAPSDYRELFGTLVFPPGTTNQTVRVPVFGDNRFEPTEKFRLMISNPSGAFLGRRPGVGTIVDDDADELDRFVWDSIASPQIAGVPFAARLRALDGLDRLATNYTGELRLRALADSREVGIGDGTNVWQFPLGTLYHDARTQVIYVPEELGGAGKLNALSLDVTSVPGQVMTNWTIRLKHVDVRSYVQPFWESDDWTVVYQNDELIQDSGQATFLFNTPFDYDGVRSLLVDFSFDNIFYSVDGRVRTTTTSERRSIFFQTDSAFGDPLGWSGPDTPPPLVLEQVPNVRFLMEEPVTVVEPTGSILVENGIWNGPVILQDAGTDIFLRASDTIGHVANGNVFTVLSAATTGAVGRAGEGLANGDQHLGGSGPTGVATATLIQEVEILGTDVVIRFAGANGKTYCVERTESLTEPDWQVVLQGLAGNGAIIEATDRDAVAGRAAFYRVRITH
jgi:hypothetical protein